MWEVRTERRLRRLFVNIRYVNDVYRHLKNIPSHFIGSVVSREYVLCMALSNTKPSQVETISMRVQDAMADQAEVRGEVSRYRREVPATRLDSSA